MIDDEVWTPHHPQVVIQHGDQEAEVDEGIAPLILELWKAGIDTMMSCQDNNGRVWLAFPDPVDATGFLNLAADFDTDVHSLYNALGAGEYEPEDWENFRENRAWHYQASPIDYGAGLGDDDELYDRGYRDFGFHISIRFPQQDYPVVLARLKAWNERRPERL